MEKNFKKEWSRKVKYIKDSKSVEIAHLQYQIENQRKSMNALIQRQIELVGELKYYRGLKTDSKSVEQPKEVA